MNIPRMKLAPHLERLRDFLRVKPTREAWQADAEFSYYVVSREGLDAQRCRQENWLEARHFDGQRMLRNLGLFRAEEINGKRILDIGAGEACVSQALALVYEPEVVVAVDAVPKQIWAAALHGVQSRIRYLVASALDLPFEEDAFDVVVAHLVVHHLPEKTALFREIARVLRPGGEFRCFEPNALPDWALSTVGRGHAESDNEAPIWPSELRRKLSEVFGVVEQRYYWNRLDTTALGPVSPGVSFVARKVGNSERSLALQLTRQPIETGVSGLEMDPDLTCRDLAEQQLRAILEATKAHEGSANVSNTHRSNGRRRSTGSKASKS